MDWFRLYHDVLDDPKVQGLPHGEFRKWINCLIVASRNHPRGQLPAVEQLAFFLRTSREEAEAICALLLARGLLESRDGVLFVHGWADRQYESDDPTPRVRKFRHWQRNVSETFPKRSQNRTEQRARTEQNRAEAEKARGRSAFVPDWLPAELWEAFLEMRKKMRKPATDKAKQLLLAKLDQLQQAGFSPAEVLEKSIMNSWLGLFEPRKGNYDGNRAAQRTANNIAAAEEALRRRRARAERASRDAG